MFATFAHIIGRHTSKTIRIQAFAIIGERKKILVHRIILVRSDPDPTKKTDPTVSEILLITIHYVKWLMR